MICYKTKHKNSLKRKYWPSVLENNHIRLTISPSVTINILDSLKACGNYNLYKTQNGTKKTSKVRDFLKEIKIEKKSKVYGLQWNII